jgi:hypothetical protein
LQLKNMKEESRVIADQKCRGEFQSLHRGINRPSTSKIFEVLKSFENLLSRLALLSRHYKKKKTKSHLYKRFEASRNMVAVGEPVAE